MHFKSDNTSIVSPNIMDAIISVNNEIHDSYGNDKYSKELKEKFSEIFEKEVTVYLTSTGTAANSLALTPLVSAYEFIACHEKAHINTNECGAPGFFTGGSILTIEGLNGKIFPDKLLDKIQCSGLLIPHMQKLGCISITQATECGTVYSLEELRTLGDIANEHQLPIHMDGARFANSIVKLKCTPADITWKSGIDVISFSGTKNGCLNAEAIIFFNQNYTKDFDYIHKMAGQLMSKTRFFAVQFLAYFKDELWLHNARHANLMAQSLEGIFKKHQIEIKYPVDTNQLFVLLDKKLANFLLERNCHFYSWSPSFDSEGLYRFVTSFSTKEEQIKEFDLLLNSYNALYK